MALKKTAARVFFISGSDEAAVKSAATARAAEIAPGADAFGLEVIDGAVETVDAAVSRIRAAGQAVLTLPFLGGSKLVWLKSASFMADSIVGRSETVIAEIDALCDVIERGLPDGVSFLMSAPEADKRRAAYKRLSKAGATEIFDRPDTGFRGGEEEVIGWCASKLRDRGLVAESDAIDVLAARVGMETRQMDNELDKLETAFGRGHKITATDMRALVPATRESAIFDVGNAISSRDLPLALGTLQLLFHQGERAVGILLATIVPTVRNLLYVKDIMARHRLPAPSQPQFFASTLAKLPASETAHLPRKKDGTINSYPLGLAARNCAHYTLDELHAGLLACAEANLQLVSSQVEESVVLSRLLTGLMARG